MGDTLEGLTSKIMNASLDVLQKMSNDMRYGIGTNSHIALTIFILNFELSMMQLCWV